MSAQHTPGPWREGKQKDAVVADIPVDGVQGSDEINWYGGHLVAESVASHNRALITAAPDMIHALKLALEYWQHRQQRYKNRAPVWVQEARAAIAKAQGAATQPAKIKCENCGKDADTKYDGDDMCRDCATYCARRDFEEGDMPGGFA